MPHLKLSNVKLEGTIELDFDLTGTTPPPTDPPPTDPPPTEPPPPPPPPPVTGHMTVSGNRILDAQGNPVKLRGVNLPDTRGDGTMAWNSYPETVAEVKRRIDAVASMGGNFIRLLMTSYGQPRSGQVQWTTADKDAGYLTALLEITRHAKSKGIVVLLADWTNLTYVNQTTGMSNLATHLPYWKMLAAAFKDEPNVIFGVTNEPKENWGGAQDAARWDVFRQMAEGIRSVAPNLIAVQGTRSWARYLGYYINRPIPVPGVVYESHPYGPQFDPNTNFDNFTDWFLRANQTLPVIVGEFGPADVGGGIQMTRADCEELMKLCEARNIPYAAWNYHQVDYIHGITMIHDNNPGGNGIGMQLQLTDWGLQISARLLKPYGAA